MIKNLLQRNVEDGVRCRVTLFYDTDNTGEGLLVQTRDSDGKCTPETEEGLKSIKEMLSHLQEFVGDYEKRGNKDV